MELTADSTRCTDILIVDDALVNLRLLAGMLTHEGYQVQEASNGFDALKMARERPPDLVLLDVRMPGMDGYEVCRQLKADAATVNIPVIFVSALDEHADKIRGFTAGGVDYITKPFHLQEVLARVDTHLTVRRLQRRLEEQNTRLQQEILERRKAEAALQAAKEDLEQRVEARTAELEEANQSLNLELIERRRAETERERLMIRVERQVEQVREIMNTVPEGLLLLDADLQVVIANPAAQKYLKILNDPHSVDRLDRLGDRPIHSLLTSPPHGLFHEITRDAAVFEVYTRPVTGDGHDQRWVILIRNVTREREVQRRLLHQDRLAAVGQMAAGIAHDFNNILAVIVLYSDMALNSPDIPPRLLERLQIIAQQSRRASELIEQILDFSRRSVLEPRTMNLLPFVKEQVKLLERTLPENIRIELLIAPDEFTIEADPTRIQQMIMNLAVNARDAMPHGGRLSITLSRRDPQQTIQCISCGKISDGDWICLAVQDTGAGIHPKDLPYIFEPFFTTKEPGKGTGLGLAQVYGIVKSHSGHLQVESREGWGTIFYLFLPAIAAEKKDAEDTDPTKLVRGRGQTILLVEDDAAARHALMEGLTLVNYHVVPAANGREALDYWLGHPSLIDLVLSDVVMPEMGGVGLLRALRENSARLPIIFMTGHPIPKSDAIDSTDHPMVWIQKPVRLKQLSFIIAQALSEN